MTPFQIISGIVSKTLALTFDLIASSVLTAEEKKQLLLQVVTEATASHARAQAVEFRDV